MNAQKIRKAVLAGSWYSRDARELRLSIENYLLALPQDHQAAEVVALVSPHAGHQYSGRVAACAYKRVVGRSYDSLFIIGPSHRQAFHGVSIMAKGAYETPLGIVEIDEKRASLLASQTKVVRDLPQVHLQEHAIEIQLPFVQVTLPGIPFVPLIMGDQSRETCQLLAEAIKHAASGSKVLIVASSDLSHFHPASQALKMDSLINRHLAAMDPEGLLQTLACKEAEACGGGPMAATMLAAKLIGATNARVLCYADSGDVNGDKSRVVGYVAAEFCL